MYCSWLELRELVPGEIDKLWRQTKLSSRPIIQGCIPEEDLAPF